MGSREESLNPTAWSREVERVERLCLPYLHRGQTQLRLHGLEHLREVARLAGRIAAGESHDRLRVISAIVAGFLHDMGRVHDGHDPAHGPKSRDLAGRVLREQFPHLPADPIALAIEAHADGCVTADPVAAAVWDADRLTLARAGITPRAEFFSTATGRGLAGFGTEEAAPDSA
jgi:HD superfamily phosphodiesterase